MSRFVLTHFMCALFATALINTCDASLAIQVADGMGNVAVVTDNGPGDGNATLGAVMFNGPLGAGSWIVNVTTGIGSPVIGAPTLPNLHLNSVNVAASGAGTLRISVTQTDFVQSVSAIPFTFMVGGVTAGSFSASGYANSNNSAFSTGGSGASQIGTSLGPFGAAFSGSTSGSPSATAGAGSYSLTIDAVIDHTGLNGMSVTSFDAELRGDEAQVIPEPASIAGWLVFGLMGVALFKIKRRREQN